MPRAPGQERWYTVLLGVRPPPAQAERRAPEPRVVKDFGPYRIVRKIAAGGMAELYLARQRGIEGLERTVVIKRILPTFVRNDEFVTMFLDEARLLGALSHPHIAQVFDLGKVDDTYYMVMEYVRGPTLRALLSASDSSGEGGLPEKEAIGIALAIGEALAYAHARRDELGRPLGIVHRDLNPANVMVSYDGAVELIDFGIAKAATKVYETRTGVIKGTYGYIAPEQLRREKVDHRADVFALGVLLYEMLVGRHPFDVSEAPDLFDTIRRANYRRPREVAPEIPEALDELVARCLSPTPEGRPGDVRAVIDALAAHMAHRGVVCTMGDIARLAQGLVPDTEGDSPVRPLGAARRPLRPGGASEHTIELRTDDLRPDAGGGVSPPTVPAAQRPPLVVVDPGLGTAAEASALTRQVSAASVTTRGKRSNRPPPPPPRNTSRGDEEEPETIPARGPRGAPAPPVRTAGTRVSRRPPSGAAYRFSQPCRSSPGEPVGRAPSGRRARRSRAWSSRPSRPDRWGGPSSAAWASS